MATLVLFLLDAFQYALGAGLVFLVGVFLYLRWFPASGMRRCKHCRMPIPDTASACPHCTRSLSAWRRLRDGF